ncbi:MAG: 50S ribosomal protein L18 [Candidatus Aminicenantaceae bacterium]
MFKNNVVKKKIAGQRVRKRIRKKISGTPERPRVLVTRSNRYLYVQAIDDINGKVLSSACTLEKAFRDKHKNFKNVDAAKALGDVVAGRFKEKKIKTIVFDRGVSPYHGRIKNLADAMRKGGLVF